MNGADRFAWLSDLKDKASMIPGVVLSSEGGFIAFWTEFGEKPEIGPSPYKHFYRVVDAKRKVILNRVQTDFSVNPYLLPRNVIDLQDKKLLVVSWKMVEMLSEPPGYRLEKIILDLNTGTILGPDTSNINFNNCTLLQDSKHRIYAVDPALGWDYRARIVKVYPEFGKIKKVIRTENAILSSFLTSDNAVTITTKDELLFCYRLKTKSDKPIWEAPDSWAGMPNHLAYFLTDLNGNLIIEPIRIDLTKDAFRKIPGVHLGGTYSIPNNIAFNDLDLSNLPNGEIILSVTGKDEKGNLCVYQVKFDSKGRLVKSNESLKIIEPREFPKDLSLSVMKVVPSSVELEVRGDKGIGKAEYVLFGFDEEGNFYEEREVWKEGEE